jgi:hypothetical protein
VTRGFPTGYEVGVGIADVRVTDVRVTGHCDIVRKPQSLLVEETLSIVIDIVTGKFLKSFGFLD